MNAALEEVELDDLCDILNVPHLKYGRTKQAIIEDFFQNHPAPSWRIIADHLYMYSNNGYGKYHATLQVVKLQYLKGKKVMLSYTCTYGHELNCTLLGWLKLYIVVV